MTLGMWPHHIRAFSHFMLDGTQGASSSIMVAVHGAVKIGVNGPTELNQEDTSISYKKLSQEPAPGVKHLLH